MEGFFQPDLMGIHKHFAIIIITYISHNTFHKIKTALAKFVTTTELLNTTRKAHNSTQEKTYRIYEETKNNKKLNYHNSSVRNAVVRTLSQSDQLTKNNPPLLVISNRLVST
jgi:hypothetical protein